MTDWDKLDLEMGERVDKFLAGIVPENRIYAADTSMVTNLEPLLEEMYRKLPERARELKYIEALMFSAWHLAIARTNEMKMEMEND